MSKKYVSVIAKFNEEGKITPLALVWEDGRNFNIDRVTDIRKSASLKAGGIGLRFTCFIRGKQVYLYKDEDKWFIEGSD